MQPRVIQGHILDEEQQWHSFPVKAHDSRQRQCGHTSVSCIGQTVQCIINAQPCEYLWCVTLLFVSFGGVKASRYLTLRWEMLASYQVEVKRRKSCLLNYWKHGGDISRTKRVPAEKCHPDPLPSRGCLSANLPTMHLDAHTDKHRLLNTEIFIPTACRRWKLCH